jgi:TonB family protein
MKNIISIWYLGVVLFSSCNSSNINKKTGSAIDIFPDTAITRVNQNNERDNYLLDEIENQDNGPIYMYCEKMPEFPGGEDAFINFVRNNVKYPQAAVKEKIEGRVVLKFIIRESGKYSDLRILRSVRPDLDDECLRVLQKMPVWTPGMIDGKPVAVSFSIPIRFILNDIGNLSGFYILPE